MSGDLDVRLHGCARIREELFILLGPVGIDDVAAADIGMGEVELAVVQVGHAQSTGPEVR